MAATIKTLLPVTVALFLSLVCLQLGVQAFRNRVPDCSAIINKATFETYKDVCFYVTNNTDIEWSLANKLDLIEMCTCNLLSHELAWAVMITHPAECMYLSVIKLIDQLDSEANNSVGMPRNSAIFQMAPDGQRMYYWDRWDNILATECTDEVQCQELATKFNIHLASIYYEPSKFAIEFSAPNAAYSMSMNRFVTATCDGLVGNMTTTLGYLGRLRELSGNERYLLRVTNYNEDLHMIRMILQYCKVMGQKGILINV